MSNLTECLSKYGSDKIANGYVPVYTALFRHPTFMVDSLLEVGIGTMLDGVPSSMARVAWRSVDYQPGASLKAWRDYFPHAQVVGIDPQPDCQFADERIMTIQADSTDTETMRALGRSLSKAFDVIIDDGLHTIPAQMATLNNLWTWLRPGGLYIIEDVHPGHPDQWAETMAQFAAVVDTLPNADRSLLWHYPIARPDIDPPLHYGMIVLTKPYPVVRS